MIFLPLIFLEKASYSKLGSNVFKSLPSPFIQRVSMRCWLCARCIWGYWEENKDFCLSQGTRQVIKVKYSKYSVSEAIACWKPWKKETGPRIRETGSSAVHVRRRTASFCEWSGTRRVTRGQRAGGGEGQRSVCVGGVGTARAGALRLDGAWRV